MQVEVARRGGLAGVTVRGTADTAHLPAAAAAAVEAALQRLPFDRPPSPPRHPDSFQYEITLANGGTRRSVVLDEAELPEAVRPVIDAAVAHGRLD